jgi:Xaa-Pro dipeptidase
VQAANEAGRRAAAPGVPAQVVDRAARQVIAAAGFGPQFTHRTGHGIGKEAHEPPYIRGDNLELLAPGMTFTVEPGIYLEGRGGVRIEDNVVITPDGSESLSTLDRSLAVIG